MFFFNFFSPKALFLIGLVRDIANPIHSCLNGSIYMYLLSSCNCCVRQIFWTLNSIHAFYNEEKKKKTELVVGKKIIIIKWLSLDEFWFMVFVGFFIVLPNSFIVVSSKTSKSVLVQRFILEVCKFLSISKVLFF